MRKDADTAIGRSRTPASIEDDEPYEFWLELTQAQVRQIVQQARGTNNLAVLLERVGDVREAMAREPDLLRKEWASRSLLLGLLVMAGLPADGTYIRAADLAYSLDISPSTIHRYLATLLLVGLAEQDPATRHYRLAA